jgi:hypothetical protein
VKQKTSKMNRNDSQYRRRRIERGLYRSPTGTPERGSYAIWMHSQTNGRHNMCLLFTKGFQRTVVPRVPSTKRIMKSCLVIIMMLVFCFALLCFALFSFEECRSLQFSFCVQMMKATNNPIERTPGINCRVRFGFVQNRFAICPVFLEVFFQFTINSSVSYGNSLFPSANRIRSFFELSISF